VQVRPGDGGAVEVNETTASASYNTFNFDSGVYVRLEAMPAAGYAFAGWAGSISSADNPTTVSMTCNKDVTASFTQTSSSPNRLTIKVQGQGSTNPSGIQSYAKETTVTITATPAEGWKFDGWTGYVADPRSQVTTVTVDSAETVTAAFSKDDETGRWLIGGAIGAFAVVGVVIWLVIRSRRA
jgi:cobalamin biosynthesis Mg chelatase CobN